MLLKKIMFYTSLLCMLLYNALCYAEEDLLPVLTICKGKTGPVMNGTLNVDGWKHAAVATGFADLSGTLSKDDTKVYITYDEWGIYIAITSTVAGTPRSKVKKRDDTNIFSDDIIEIRLNTNPANPKDYYLFAGNCTGTIYDTKNGNPSWNGKWIFKNQVKDSGASSGGVETFAQSTWNAEVAISFKDLGVSVPKDGDMWRVNFCRSWDVEKGKNQVTKWTSWSPASGGNFNDPKGFGYLYFREKAPIIKVMVLEDPTGGNIEINGSVANFSAKSVDINTYISVILANTGKEIIKKRFPLTVNSDKSSVLKIKESVALRRSLPLQFLYLIKDSKGNILYRNMHCFSSLPAFRCSADLFFGKGVVEINYDISRLSLPSSFRAMAQIIRKKDNSVVNSFTIKELRANNRKCTSLLDISKLQAGNYVIKVFIKDNNRTIAQRDEELTIPKKPVWWKNKLGISDQVPPPWFPVAVKKNTISVWGRDYQFADMAFPSQIINQKTAMLSAPISLEIVTNKGLLKWEKSELKHMSQTDTKVKLRMVNTCPSLKMNSDIEVEYDGFIRIDFSLSAKTPVVIKSMALHIPLKRESALYMKGIQVCPKSLGYSACLYDGAEGNVVKKNIWAFSAKGWIWENDFMHYVWVGGDTTGLSVSFDSDKGFHSKKYVEVLNEKYGKDIKINFIDTPYSIKKTLKYTLALHATPVKPLPTDPRKFHFGSINSSAPADVFKGLYAGVDGGGLDNGPAWPGLNAYGKQSVKKLGKEGIRVFPDGSYWWCCTKLPEFKSFGKEWEMQPVFRMPQYRYNISVAGVCRKGSYADFLLWGFNKRIDDGVKGLYNDGSNLTACNAACHGCGYVNREGKRVATVNLFGTRETYKRIYTLFKSRVPDSFILVHNVPVSPLASFTDGTCEGESWDEGDYSNLLPDLFRAGFATYNQLGIPFNLYAFVSYGWRYQNGKPNVPPDELMPICLSYNIYPLGCGSGGDNNIGMTHLNPIWEIMDEWRTTSEWIPYWKSRYLAKTSDNKVKVSIYRKKKKALFLVTNLEKQTVQSGIDIDIAGLGIAKDKVKFTKITPAKITIKNNKPVKISSIKKEEMLLVDGKINVTLPRRSMQFYLLEEK